MGRAKNWWAVSPIKDPTYVRVPVGEDLEKEIREGVGPEMDHVKLSHQILVLVRQGLRYEKLLHPLHEKAVDECAQEELQLQRAPRPKCRILPFPK